MFEIKLTKETAIANVLRQMMGISKENMDTKMEYLQKVLNEYESDGLDLREHVGAFGVREITDKKSLAKHINIIIKDCKHSANLISIEFDFAEKQKVLHTLTNIAVIADHILKLPETILLNYLADKWFEKGTIHTYVNNLKESGLSTNTEVDEYLANDSSDFRDIADNDADENAIVCLLLKMIFLDVLESQKNQEEDSDKLAFKKEIDEQMQYLAGWIRDDYKTLGIELGTAMIDLGINLNIKDGKFYMNYDFIGFCNKFNETDKGSLNLHEKVEEAIEHISKNFDDYSKNVLVHHLKSIAVGTEKTLKLPQTKLLKLLMDRWDLSSEFHSTIESLWEWEVKADSEAEIYLKNLEKKDDPVSLKEESDKTSKTGKQIASEDEVADSATVKTDDKNIKDQQPSKKSKTKYPLLEKYNLSSKEAVTVYLLDRMIMADGNKDQRESIAFVKITLGKPELIPFIMNVSDAFDNASENDDLDKLVDVSIKYVANEMSSEEIKDLLAYLAKIIVADEVFDASENKLLRKCCEAWDGALGWDAYASLVSFIEVKYGITIDDLGTSEDDSKSKKQKSKKSIQDSKKIPAWEKIKAAMESFGTDYVATNKEIMDYCNEHYGEVKDSTFRTYIISCTVNHDTRVHYSPNKKPRTELLDNDVLFQVEKGKVCHYDPKKHGDWHIKLGDDGKLHPVKS